MTDMEITPSCDIICTSYAMDSLRRFHSPACPIIVILITFFFGKKKLNYFRVVSRGSAEAETVENGVD